MRTVVIPRYPDLQGRIGPELLDRFLSSGARTQEPESLPEPARGQDAATFFAKIVEQQIARTAAERRSADDVEVIRRAVGEYARASGRDARRLADHALHQAIARATHNTRLVDLSARIRREVGLGFDAEPYTPEMRRRALRQHPTLAEAIIAGDPGRAARLADNHFSLTDTTLTDLRARLHLRSGGDTDARSQG